MTTYYKLDHSEPGYLSQMLPRADGTWVKRADYYADFAAAQTEIERLTKERDEARAQVAFNPTTVMAGATETPRAWLDVMGERVRQITVEGWTTEHDDTHVEGELAGAASAYAMSAAAAIQLRRDAPLRDIPPFFMFDPSRWKPTNARRDLVKAGALILAEIERLDRAADKEGQPQ